MPDDLTDFFRQSLSNQFGTSSTTVPRVATGGPGAGGAQVFGTDTRSLWERYNPFKTGYGATVKTGMNLLTGVSQSVDNLLQSVSPVGIPGATDKPVTNPSIIGNLSERSERMANALSFGFLDKLNSRADRETEAVTRKAQLEGRQPNLEEYTKASVFAAGKFLGLDILPGQEIKEMLSGQKLTGYDKQGNEITRPLTATEFGEDFSQGLLKVGLVKESIRPGEAVKPTKPIGPTRSRGEIDAAAMERFGMTPEEVTQHIEEGKPFISRQLRTLKQKETAFGKGQPKPTPPPGYTKALDTTPVLQNRTVLPAPPPLTKSPVYRNSNPWWTPM